MRCRQWLIGDAVRLRAVLDLRIRHEIPPSDEAWQEPKR
jgi:hypothetical protein